MARPAGNDEVVTARPAASVRVRDCVAVCAVGDVLSVAFSGKSEGAIHRGRAREAAAWGEGESGGEAARGDGPRVWGCSASCGEDLRVTRIGNAVRQ